MPTIDVLRVGEKPIAALIRLEQGGLSIPWKIAFDEDVRRLSLPGKQLMCDETRRWLADPTVSGSIRSARRTIRSSPASGGTASPTGPC